MIFATLAFVMTVSCGGGDSKGSPLSGKTGGSGGATWDIAKADDLSHAALLVAGDLPGSGWTVTDDDFKDEPSKSTACSEADSLAKESRTAYVARAKRKLAREGASGATTDTGTEIISSVEIYRDARRSPISSAEPKRLSVMTSSCAASRTSCVRRTMVSR